MVGIQNMIRAVKRSLRQTGGRHEATPPPKLSPELTLLQQWLESRQLLAIESTQGTEQTMILAIDRQRGVLWLDECVPGHHRLRPGDTVTLCHHSGTQLILAHTEILGQRAYDNTAALAVRLPPTLQSQPRRREWRYHPPKGSMSARIRAVGGEPLSVSIINLSAGGMRLSIRGNQRYHMRPGALLPLCQFELGGLCRVRCRARVKACRLERHPNRHTQVSLEFVDIGSAQRAAIVDHLNRLAHLTDTTGLSRAA